MLSGLGIYTKIMHEIETGEAHLPTLPDVALRIRRAMQHPNCDLATIEGIIQTDAGLSAHLIQMANSSLYRGWRETRDLKRAVSLFGQEMTRNLCLSYSLRAMFRHKTPTLRTLLQTAWKDSAHRAALSAVLAKQCRRISPDRALLAGLLQEIGLPLLYVRLEKHPEALDNSDIIHELAEDFSARISVTLLESWGFDDELLEVARSRHDWLRDDQSKPDLADVVLLATWHVRFLTDGAANGLPPLDRLPAYHRLKPGPISPGGTLEIFDDAVDIREIETTMTG